MKLIQNLTALVLAIATTLTILTVGMLGRADATVETPAYRQPEMIATAPTPPELVTEVLNGQPIPVLYMTRFGDQVLTRCYPGYQPKITLRAMGSNPQATGMGVQREGVIVCESSEGK